MEKASQCLPQRPSFMKRSSSQQLSERERPLVTKVKSLVDSLNNEQLNQILVDYSPPSASISRGRRRPTPNNVVHSSFSFNDNTQSRIQPSLLSRNKTVRIIEEDEKSDSESTSSSSSSLFMMEKEAPKNFRLLQAKDSLLNKMVTKRQNVPTARSRASNFSMVPQKQSLTNLSIAGKKSNLAYRRFPSFAVMPTLQDPQQHKRRTTFKITLQDVKGGSPKKFEKKNFFENQRFQNLPRTSLTNTNSNSPASSKKQRASDAQARPYQRNNSTSKFKGKSLREFRTSRSGITFQQQEISQQRSIVPKKLEKQLTAIEAVEDNKKKPNSDNDAKMGKKRNRKIFIFFIFRQEP